MELNRIVFPSPSPSYTADNIPDNAKILYIPKFSIYEQPKKQKHFLMD